MTEFDTDGSGRIDFQEFIDCLLQVCRGNLMSGWLHGC